MVQVVPYDPNWPQMFELEAQKVRAALGENLIAIHHVGSTSVPGLSAKPKIDMVAQVLDLTQVTQKLENLGYIYRGCFNVPLRKSFMLRRPELKVNFYLFEGDDPEMELMIRFRDFLRLNPEAQREYEDLKFELIKKEESHYKNNSIFVGYTLGKNAFIQQILKQTGFNRHRFVFCTHFAEWEKARYFRKEYFFDQQKIKDPFQWTFDHPDHRHLLLYHGCDIVGYAHVELLDEQKAMIHMAIEDARRNRGLGTRLLSLCERWLKTIGIKTLLVDLKHKDCAFYRRQGFWEMPLIDDNFQNALGKEL